MTRTVRLGSTDCCHARRQRPGWPVHECRLAPPPGQNGDRPTAPPAVTRSCSIRVPLLPPPRIPAVALKMVPAPARTPVLQWPLPRPICLLQSVPRGGTSRRRTARPSTTRSSAAAAHCCSRPHHSDASASSRAAAAPAPPALSVMACGMRCSPPSCPCPCSYPCASCLSCPCPRRPRARAA